MTSSDRGYRASSAMSGFVLAVVAIVGLNYAFSGTASTWVGQKSSAMVARTIAPAGSCVLAPRAGICWIILALVAFLYLRARACEARFDHPHRAEAVALRSQTVHSSLLRRFAVSWRSGGLYGP